MLPGATSPFDPLKGGVFPRCFMRVRSRNDNIVDLHFGLGVFVGDGHDVELSRVRKRADTEGLLPDERQHREHLEQPGSRKVERCLWTREVGAGHVHALTVDELHDRPAGDSPSDSAVEEDPQVRVTPRLALRGLGRDLAEPASRIGLTDGEWDDHLADQVPPRIAALLLVERHGNVDRDDDTFDGLSTAAEELAQAAGDHREQDIVHLRVVRVCEFPDEVDPAADERDGTVRADSTVQARLGPRLLGEDLAHRRPRSEEHTSELQSRPHLVCRLLLEKKKKKEAFSYSNKKKKRSITEIY